MYKNPEVRQNIFEELIAWTEWRLYFVIIGALNWGSIGIFGFDLVAYAFADRAPPSAVHIYACGSRRNLVHLTAVPRTGYRRRRITVPKKLLKRILL
jgi:hypothetical protein